MHSCVFYGSQNKFSYTTVTSWFLCVYREVRTKYLNRIRFIFHL